MKTNVLCAFDAELQKVSFVYWKDLCELRKHANTYSSIYPLLIKIHLQEIGNVEDYYL